MKWKTVRLGDVCTFKTGKTPSTKKLEYFNGSINWFTPGDIGDSKFLKQSVRTITDLALKENQASLLPKNTLLVTCIGEIGRVGIITKPACSNQQITGLTFDERVLSKYAYYWFIFNRNVIKDRSNNAVVPILNNAALREITFTFPPLHIQEQIADTLDKADALRRKDQELLTKYDELAQAIFYDMFGDPEKNSKGWKLVELIDAVSFIDYRGKTPERSNQEDVTLITAKNVKFGYYDYSEKDYITESTYQSIMTRGFPKFNDVLFTTEGATLGNVCRIPNIPKFAVGQRLISLRGKRVTQEFLSFIMCSSFFQEQVKKKATGSAVKGIRSAELKKLIIPIPDFSIQEAFSSKLKNIEQQKISINITLSNGLFNGLMNTFFS